MHFNKIHTKFLQRENRVKIRVKHVIWKQLKILIFAGVQVSSCKCHLTKEKRQAFITTKE